jgi:transposase-like protein
LRQEKALLEEEIRLKDARMMRVPGHERPHFSPIERLAILELRALRGWSARQAADQFFLSPTTVSAWTRRLDERGPDALVQTPEPVNKYPDLVVYIVQRLKVLCPSLGYAKIAHFLCRDGLQLGTSTVRRMIRRPAAPKPKRPRNRTPRTGIVARYSNHVWHCDLTTVPTSKGFWTSVFPFSFAPRWPFCWWLVVLADQYSSRIVRLAIFRAKPTAAQVVDVIARACRQEGVRPKHLLTDKGDQFRAEVYRAWCLNMGIRRRSGSLGQFGSIPFIERVIETIKAECTRRISVPYADAPARRELALFRSWYNGVRPHERHHGATPDEAYRGAESLWKRPRFEPRPRLRREPTLDSSRSAIANGSDVRLALRLRFLGGRRHLPIVTLQRVA